MVASFPLHEQNRGKYFMKKIFCALLLATCSTFAAAATWTNGNQVVEATIWRPGYHGFYVPGGTFHNPEGCSGAANLYLFDPAFEAAEPRLVSQLLALIMLAQSTGKKVFVFVDGCTSGQPKITGLQVQA